MSPAKKKLKISSSLNFNDHQFTVAHSTQIDNPASGTQEWKVPTPTLLKRWSVLSSELGVGQCAENIIYCREENDFALQVHLLQMKKLDVKMRKGFELVMHRTRLFINLSKLTLSCTSSLNTKAQKSALCDYFHRSLHSAFASSSINENIQLPEPTQYVFENSVSTLYHADELFCDIEADIENFQEIWGKEILCLNFIFSFVQQNLLKEQLDNLLNLSFPNVVNEVLENISILPSIDFHLKCIEDQIYLRNMLDNQELDGIAFVANNSILPRQSATDDRPLRGKMVIPFQSPKAFEYEIILPNAGVVKGMLVPPGVTIIIGGGFHGKSTLLRAIATGVYNKVPGDGREFVVTASRAVTVRSEDGRPVSNVDISPFIGELPKNAKIDTSDFSTSMASGSTSQAANVIEALEAGASVMLLDEDMCAANFMVRDSRMRAIVSHEPIVPYIYRVNGMWRQLGVSSVVVVGGCGDWFDVHNQVILMDNYMCEDKTKRATSLSHTFCSGRIQYKGRGLVHRLDWPQDIIPRIPNWESFILEEHLQINALSKHFMYGNNEIDLSKIEQLVGGKGQVEGCGRALKWLAFKSKSTPEMNLAELLDSLEEELETKGVQRVLGGGFTIRPRRFEVAASLNRLACVKFSKASSVVKTEEGN